jgi:energy-coupling factor transport system ATP-binding protein
VADLVDLKGLRLERDGPEGPLRVLDGIDLRLAAGERLAVVGGNGSGKSSLLRHLATPGVLPGRRAGLVFQDPDEQLVAATVEAEFRLGGGVAPDPELLRRHGLAGRGAEDPRVLSAGQKQRLQLALVLSSRPELLLLDEPTSLQDAAQADWLRERLGAWPGAMIWATQRPEEVALCRRALLLEEGRVVVAGGAAEVLAHPRCAACLEPGYPQAVPAATGTGEAVAALDAVELAFPDGRRLGPISLALRPGDRLGVTGPNGSGKSSLLASLAGLRRPEAGMIRLGGRRLYRERATDLDHGRAALAPQFPEYLFTGATVADEVALDPRLAATPPAALLARMGLASGLAARNPHDLSGGQKRRLALGLALGSGRPLVLLDEPTAALDAGGRALVAALVRAAPASCAVVVASHDRNFLAACGCRVLDLDAATGIAARP